MECSRLIVHHRLKTRGEEETPTDVVSPWTKSAFRLETCQRELWIQDREQCKDLPGYESKTGREAYAFLLRVATGLESVIAGEADVFGQFKRAWKDREEEVSLAWLKPIIPKLFEDTKEIRARFLQGVGSESYGRLTRKLLKDAQGPALLLGAGKIAHSIAPFLTDQELWIWNRSPDRARALRSSLLAKAPAAQIQCIGSEVDVFQVQREEAISSILVCAPLDPEVFSKLLQTNAGKSKPAPILALQFRDLDASAWMKEFPKTTLYCLDSLFRLQTELGDLRTRAVEQARLACGEKAILRALGGSGIAHGWEDLAWFG